MSNRFFSSYKKRHRDKERSRYIYTKEIKEDRKYTNPNVILYPKPIFLGNLESESNITPSFRKLVRELFTI